jgi:ATP-dependent DNA helicase RecG
VQPEHAHDDPRCPADLAGVGPARARRLERAGIRTLRDLVWLLPLGLEEAPPPTPLGELARLRGREVRVRGRVARLSLARFGRRSILRAHVEDGAASVTARFFNQPWQRRQLAVGAEVELWGTLSARGELALDGPRLGSAASPLPPAGTLRAVHPALDGFSADFVGRLCRAASEIAAPLERERLPAELLARLDLPPLPEALAEQHAPRSPARFAAARRRIAFERMLELSARIARRSAARDAGQALACAVEPARAAELEALFPFAFTRAQRRAAGEIQADLARRQPMRRLLQGDVGSGKTALGVWAALLAAQRGGQTAFLAPTELLAEQHFAGLRPLLERAGLANALLTGSLPARERKPLEARLAVGEIDVVFGTHALFSADVRYRRLALAVIDEQQRFGVAQRGELLARGDDVHALLMTATPIPRTLALALYGDLDTSVLDERPAGAGDVRTRWVRHGRAASERFLAERVARGERLYWVVPRIDGEEGAAGGRGAEQRFARLQASPLAAHGVELVHGRLAAAERARRLERFQRGEVRTLVATTVIEVGLHVPEATLMVVENAERLGLAQLHQLRGRIGRAGGEAWCLLFGAESASERLRLLESTTDGFAIAEADLRLRGMGDLTGLRQAGLNLAGLADGEDLALLDAARRALAADPDLRERYGADEAVPVP